MRERTGRCAICGREIVIKSGRTKYCRECAKRQKKEQQAEYSKLREQVRQRDSRTREEEQEMRMIEAICTAQMPTRASAPNDSRPTCEGCQWVSHGYCVLPSCFREEIK